MYYNKERIELGGGVYWEVGNYSKENFEKWRNDPSVKEVEGHEYFKKVDQLDKMYKEFLE